MNWTCLSCLSAHLSLNRLTGHPFHFQKYYRFFSRKCISLLSREISELYFIMRAVWGESLCVTLYILCQRLYPAFTMADSRKTNESGAAAAEPDNGDQQVRSTVTRHDTYYETQAYYELIWRSISHCGESIIIHDRILELCPERS